MRTEYSLSGPGKGGSGGRSGRSRKPIEIAMTPMIDVIFLLLVFFLATSSFQLIEQLMPSGISDLTPSAGQVAEPPQDPSPDALEQIVVKIKAQQPAMAILNGTELADFAELRNRLQALSQARPHVPVIIDPEAQVKARDVIMAYDWARQAGLSRVYLATRK